MNSDKGNISDNNILLSVIVPVYNARNYLKRCVDSVLRGGITNIEIILVDDGSTDGSSEYIDKLCLQNFSLRVIHKNNGGPAAARNVGLDLAKGKYISFLDADDWICEDYYKLYIEKMEKNNCIDIAIPSMVYSYSNGECIPCRDVSPDIVLDNDKAMKGLLDGKIFNWGVSGKIYRSILFFNIRGDETLSFAEDVDLNFQVFPRARYVYYSAKGIYNYFVNVNSITHTMSEKKISDGVTVYKKAVFISQSTTYARHFLLTGYLRFKWFQLLINIGDNNYNDFECNHRTLKDEWFYFTRELHLEGHSFYKVFVYPINRDTRTFFDEMKQWYLEILRLLSVSSEIHNQVYIYGVGEIGECITYIMQKNNFAWNAYVISDGEKKSLPQKNGKPIRYISEINCKKDDSLFILALSKQNQTIVREMLLKKGYANILDVIIPGDT